MTPHTLVQLRDSDRILLDPADDVRGRPVRGPGGEDLGTVSDLLIDDADGMVRYLRVHRGGVLGLGATPTFVPVEAIAAVREDVVVVAEPSPDRPAGGPGYRPDTVDGQRAADRLYREFG